jgi:hypothetical protein
MQLPLSPTNNNNNDAEHTLTTRSNLCEASVLPHSNCEEELMRHAQVEQASRSSEHDEEHACSVSHAAVGSRQDATDEESVGYVAGMAVSASLCFHHDNALGNKPLSLIDGGLLDGNMTPKMKKRNTDIFTAIAKLAQASGIQFAGDVDQATQTTAGEFINECYKGAHVTNDSVSFTIVFTVLFVMVTALLIMDTIETEASTPETSDWVRSKISSLKLSCSTLNVRPLLEHIQHQVKIWEAVSLVESDGLAEFMNQISFEEDDGPQDTVMVFSDDSDVATSHSGGGEV